MQDGYKVLRWVAVLLAGVGLILGLVGAGVFYSTYGFSQTAAHSSGQVVAFATRWSSSSSRSSSSSTKRT